jgi:hypothetical protein
MDKADEDRAIGEVVERLEKTFPDLPADTVVEAVQSSRPEFDQNPIRDFIPLFVERAAKDRLRQRST